MADDYIVIEVAMPEEEKLLGHDLQQHQLKEPLLGAIGLDVIEIFVRILNLRAGTSTGVGPLAARTISETRHCPSDNTPNPR